jgi:alpha-ketoglutarate-dependent taurine dioxygenase
MTILDEEAVDLTWEQGDVVWVDNDQVLHARRPFTGPRKIMASLFK